MAEADPIDINARAPRIRPHDNLAAAAARIRRFSMNGATPFGDFDSPNGAAALLLQTDGLCKLLAAGFRDADGQNKGEPESDLADLRKNYTSQAFAAIGSLTALAVLMIEAESDERLARIAA